MHAVTAIAALPALRAQIVPLALQVGEHGPQLSANARPDATARAWLHHYGPAAVSALAVPLALPNELALDGNPLLGPFAFAPLFLSIYRSRSYAQAAAAAALFMAVATPLSYYWLLYFQEFALWTLGGPVLGYTLFGALLGPVLRGAAVAAGRLRPYAVAAAWTVYEYLKSSGFLGFPWGLAAYPVNAITPLIQFTALTGVWGLSLLMALANAAVGEGIAAGDGIAGAGGRLRPRRRQPVRAYLLVCALAAGALAYGVLRLGGAAAREPASAPQPASAPPTRFQVALIQHNRNPWGGDDRDRDESIRTLMRLTRAAIDRGAPDLIVWSETALLSPPAGPYAGYHVTPAGGYVNYYDRNPAGDPLAAFLRGLDAHLLTGAPHFDPPAQSNATFLIGPGGRWLDHYAKQQLVPFAEAVPFWEVGFVRRFYRSTVGIGRGWTAGDRPAVFTVPAAAGRSVRLSTPICFEDAFPALNRRFVRAGAELLVNVTNDSWSRTVSAETQHLAAARFRAVETARPLLRATNGGITAAIDVYGRKMPGSELAPFTEDFALVTLRLPAAPATTPYTRYGDYLPIGLIIALVAVLVRRAARSGRRRRSRRTVRRTAATTARR